MDDEFMHETDSESPDIAGSGEPSPAAKDGEQVSIFAPKAALMGKEVKEGDTVEMKVMSVDPETGDVELQCVYDKTSGSKAMGDMFEEEVPEEA